MEPVTHLLTGACLARTGFNRKAAYATLTMAVAAEFPDIDTFWSLRGPIEGFQHHRGITHTFLGLPFEAAFLVAAVYGLHRWRVARQTSRPSKTKEGRRAAALTVAPVRWGALYWMAVIALLSHLLLDYTNNYGLRPLYPFNSHWYAASIVFIFDPAIFGMLLIALTAPALFGLIGAEVGARRQAFRGRGWAIAALAGMAGLWSLRALEHEKALNVAMAQSIPAPADPLPAGAMTATLPVAGQEGPVAMSELAPSYLQPVRTMATPDPIDPFHWSTATDFGVLYQLAEIDTRNGSLTPALTTYLKPSRESDVLLAEHTRLGRAYIDWSPMPIVDVSRPDSALAAVARVDPNDDDHLTVVTFRDPRFMGGWLRDLGRSALTGTVSIDAAGRVVRQTMDEKVER